MLSMSVAPKGDVVDKTLVGDAPQEAKAWGGTAGKPYDPCYHRVCDTLANVDLRTLDVNAHALGFAILQYAMNTSDINGIPGRDDFPPVSPAP